MNRTNHKLYKLTKQTLLIAFVLCYSLVAWSQQPVQDSVKTGFSLGNIKIPNPNSVESKYTYDPLTDRYIYTEKIGEFNINYPIILSPKEYYALVAKENLRHYYKDKIDAFDGKKEGSEDERKNLLPEFYINSGFFESIFGSNTIEVVPQGSVEMDLGVLFSKQDNPTFSPRNRSNFTFDFDQRISLSLLGKVGTRLQVTANYDTQSTFDFQQLIKLEYTPTEDDIIQKIEVGNVSMPLNSSLITGAQSLFGVKAQLQFGKTTVTAVFSEQKSQANTVIAQGGGTLEEFEFFIREYDENRHFFLAQYFRDEYDNALANYPFINNKGLQITRLEIWVTNRSNRTENVRNIVALQDLGESDKVFSTAVPIFSGPGAFPDNENNGFNPITITTGGSSLTQQIRDISTADQGFGTLSNDVNEGSDYAKLENARKLINGQEYNLNTELGYISLNQRLNNDEVLAVAFQYTVGGQVYQVGEFANDGVNSTATGNDLDGDNIPNSIDSDVDGDGTLDNGTDTDGDGINDTGDSDINNDGTIDNGPDANGDGINDNFVTIQEGSTQSLVVKMLKSPITNVKQPIWDLMMKNVYDTGAFNLSQDDFTLNIFYNEASPLNFIRPIPEAGEIEEEAEFALDINGNPVTTSTPSDDLIQNSPLLRVFNLDKLNFNNDPQSRGDGFFDYVPGITVIPQNGKIVFTSAEPFGEYLFNVLGGGNYNDDNSLYNDDQKKYVYDILYKSTKTEALDEIEKNKFKLKGRYKSSGGGDGIPIGAFNVPRGSVRVTAGGRVLVEGIDYTVNYQLGRVQILDESLKASNTPIQVSTENNAVFGQQTRRFTGLNIEHKFNENFVLGGTLLNLNERPVTQKANFGNESINNTIFGLNGNYSTKVPFLTRLANKLPNIDTDVESNLSLRGEFAYLAPGAPKGTNFNGEATSYIDDFEGSQNGIDLKSQQSWFLSSRPLEVNGSPNEDRDGIQNGYDRALLNWYTIDPIFYSSQRPGEISDDDVSGLYTSRVFINELFPERDLVQGQNSVLFTLDLAYYPEERGPYNFEPGSEDDELDNPEQSWAGITRQITSTDFEQQNVEYIDFWLQDPFQDSPTNPGGKLVFNLGNISEDIIKDGKKLYENGLPDDGDVTILKQQSTSWGTIVPQNQSLIYAFDTTGDERDNQDVGYDGYSDAEEIKKFGALFGDDPSNDNYSYFLSAEGDIFERYKKYNGVEGNTPDSFSDTDRGANTQPDVEDINRDNTMNTIDSYFEYELDLTRQNLPQSQADFDNIPDSNPLKGFLRDFKDRPRSLPNGDSRNVRWYQFRIPVEGSHVKAVNGINDLRSVRFTRIYLKDFEEATVFRFGTLDLVRSDWRRYTQALDKEVGVPAEDPQTDFSVGVIGTLENEGSYQRPPGIEPEELFNNNTVVSQNEQSLVVKACNLETEDSRGVFKNINLDMRQYKRMRMFMHAEDGESETGSLASDDLVGFIRMGNDLTENYYQIEIPLQVSTSTSREGLWPTANEINLPIDVLGQIKAQGISDMTLSNEDPTFYDVINGEIVAVADPFGGYVVGQHRVGIKGNPNFGDIRTLMVGVKNASTDNELCAEVWFNELRLSDLDNEGGWAAVVSMDTNIADFANISATGRQSTSGFGSLEQGPSQRSLEDVKQYDVVTNINVGQLLPKKWGIQVPFNYGQSEELITPKYDQFYKDLTLDSRLDAADSNAKREEIKEQSEDYTKRQSINFIGVRKNRTTDKKPRFYDVENVTLNYSYNKVEHRDFEIENAVNKTLRIGANYAHNFNPVRIEPFKKNDSLFTGKYWKILKDFNFNLLPTSFTINTDVNRQFNRQKFREIDLTADSGNIGIEELFRRNYTFDFQYTINYNLTNSLQFNFTAANNNIVRNYFKDNDLIAGEQDENLDVWDGLLDIGDPNRQTQNLGITYQLPLNKIPTFSFIDATYQYTGSFQWQKGSDLFGNLPVTKTVNNVETTNFFDLGNTVQNSSVHNINTSLDMKRFYKYIGLVKKPIRRVRKRTTPGGGAPPGAKQDDTKKKTKKPKNQSVTKLLNAGVDILTSIKRIQVNYSENNGTFLPGYLNTPGFIGTLKPTVGFTFGSQSDVRYLAAKRGWLTTFDEFNQQYTSTNTKQLDISASLQPVRDLKIDIVGNRAYYQNYTENYIVENGVYNPLTPNTFGNFNISTVLIKTAFSKSDETSSPAFDDFRGNRLKIAERLAEKFYGTDAYTRDTEGYPEGFGKNNQKVLLPAFLAAYSGQDANKITTNAFRDIPIPNWDLKYTGFMKFKWFKKRFKRFSVTHGYRSAYTINQFNTNLDFDSKAVTDPNDSNTFQLDQAGNFKNERLFSNINLTELFSPLVRIDLEMKSSIRILAEIKKDRMLSLSFDNNLVTEVQGNEYILGLGYRIKDLRIRSKLAGPKKRIVSDLNMKADISMRDNKTIIRYLDLENNQITSGQTIWGLKYSADYAFSKNLTGIFYFDYTFSDYAISTAFPQTTIRSGFTIRYNFGN